MDEHLRESAALVALLQQPHARWQEIALDILEAGSAMEVLQSSLGTG